MSGRALDRRAVLAAGVAGVAALAGCGGEDDDQQRRAREGGDLEIVSFAATLEAVETAFWRQVVQRRALDEAGGGALAAQVERNEREHLAAIERVLEERLGAPPGPSPGTDFTAVFEGGAPEVLRTAAMLENLSAAAYLGQASRVQDRTLLAQVVAIHTVEARQAAALNQLAARGFRGSGVLDGALPTGAFAEPMDMVATLRRLEPYLVNP